MGMVMNIACSDNNNQVQDDPEEIDDPVTDPNAKLVPTVRIASTVSIPDTNDPGLKNPIWLLDNIGRDWVLNLPLNTYVVFKLEGSYSQILFQWMSSANYNYDVTQYGCPSGYEIQVSSNSTNGNDGSWDTVVDESNNLWAARAHHIKNNDIQWVRFRVTSGGSNIDEIDIHDLSNSDGHPIDTWGFIGDSKTADTFWRNKIGAPQFNEKVHELVPERFPSMINFGIGGNNSEHLLARLQQTINNNKGIYFWAVAIGTNDGDAEQFENNLKQIIETLLENGKQPIVARIAYRTDSNNQYVQAFNIIIDRLVEEYELPAGPDLYSYFEQNPEHLRDGLHPTYTDGVRAIQRLWAEVAAKIK